MADIPERLPSRPATSDARLLRLSRALLPRAHAAWGEAMQAEFANLDADEQARWVAGCLIAALRLRATDHATLHVVLAPLLLVALIVVDWHTMETALTLTLLMAVAGLLGYLRPALALASGIGAGEVLLAAHIFANYTGLWRPFYQCKPLQMEDWLIIGALAAPALAAALAGATFKRYRGATS